jgi:hypothetical protein
VIVDLRAPLIIKIKKKDSDCKRNFLVQRRLGCQGLLIRDTCCTMLPSYMRSLTKTTMTITVAAFILAMTASMMFATAYAASSIRVTQSTEDGSNSLTQSTVTQSTEDGSNSLTQSTVTQSTEDGSNSLRVTQSLEGGLKVECEGNLNCEIIGDDTVIATSEDNNTASTTTTLDQSDITEFSNDFDVIDDEQDLGAMIEGWVDRLLDAISANLANLAISI